MLLGALRFDFLILKNTFSHRLLVPTNSRLREKLSTARTKFQKKSTKLALRVIAAKKMIDSTSLRFV